MGASAIDMRNCAIDMSQRCVYRHMTCICIYMYNEQRLVGDHFHICSGIRMQEPGYGVKTTHINVFLYKRHEVLGVCYYVLNI